MTIKPNLPSKCLDWLQVAKGRAGLKPVAAASLWGDL